VCMLVLVCMDPNKVHNFDCNRNEKESKRNCRKMDGFMEIQ